MKIEITILKFSIIFRLMWLDKTKFLFRLISLWIGWQKDKRLFTYIKFFDVVMSGHGFKAKFKELPYVCALKKTVIQKH